MTTVQITLPDELASDAAKAGLLSSDSIGELLRERLRERRRNELFTAMDRMAEVDTPDYMSPEELAVEIRAMRAEKRTHAQSGCG
jgi:Arc/MetJ family transcription regulator